MLYIITEDSNSAEDFWNIVASTFRGKGQYVLYKPPLKSKGNTTLMNQVISLFKLLKQGDELLVVFDNISNSNNFNAANFIQNTNKECQARGVKLKFTSYYCFEEIYLSYIELLKMYESITTDNITLNALKFVQNSLINGNDYFVKSNKNISDFIATYKRDSGKNREHFANALLMATTQLIYGHFSIIKKHHCFSDKAECWVKDCNSIQSKMHPEYQKNLCTNCKYCCKNNDTKNKLLDLENKSICLNSTYTLSKI